MKNAFYKPFALILSLLFLTSCSDATESESSDISSEISATTVPTKFTSLTDTDTYTTTISSAESSEVQSSQTESIPTEITTTPSTFTESTVTTTTTILTTQVTTPLPIVIPTIKTVSSPGIEIYSNDFAAIDVSNKSEGYFTAKYTGNSKKVKIQVSKDGKKYAYDLSTNGSYDVFPLQMGNGTYSIFIGENVSGTSYAGVLVQDITVSVTNGNAMYLYSNQQINFSQNSNTVSKAAEICAGKTTDVQKVSAIFEYITSNISYDYTLASQITSGAVSTYLPSPDRTLSSQKGICYDYAALFAAMCRSQGIPAKLVKGYVGPDNIYHAWNEVYLAGTGWVTADFKINIAGWNPLDSTFYSSATNKKVTAGRFNDSSYYKTAYFY